jgi:thioesterase domain-containing protein
VSVDPRRLADLSPEAKRALLAELLRNEAARAPQGRAEPSSAFVAIQPHGSRPPFYVGGSNFLYADLARHLGPDQPFYRLDAYALKGQRSDSGQKPYSQIEAMAAAFVKEIRAVQPVGPYFLGGGCEGALVAFEIVQQLQRAGQRTALIIWETPAPRYFQRSLVRIVRHAASASLAAKWRGERPWDLIRDQYVEYAMYYAMAKYTPQPYRGRIVLIRAAQQQTQYHDPTAGWGEIASEGAEVHVVPGNHKTYLKEHFLDFADRLKACLEKMQADAS